MPSVIDSNTTSALVIGTETDLRSAYAPAAVGPFQWEIDCGAIASGEVLIIRFYKVLLASGTERPLGAGTYIGGMDEDPMVQSVPIEMATGTGINLRASLQQKNGTGRTFPWTLYSLA